MKVRLVDVLYEGERNYSLRLLANGRFMCLEACRSLDEYHLVHNLLLRFRDRDSLLKLRKLGQKMAQEKGRVYEEEGVRSMVWKDVSERIEAIYWSFKVWFHRRITKNVLSPCSKR